MGATLGAKGSHNENMPPLVPRGGDQGVVMDQVADAKDNRGEQKENKRSKMMTKAEAVQLYEANLKMKKEEERQIKSGDLYVVYVEGILIMIKFQTWTIYLI